MLENDRENASYYFRGGGFQKRKKRCALLKTNRSLSSSFLFSSFHPARPRGSQLPLEAPLSAAPANSQGLSAPQHREKSVLGCNSSRGPARAARAGRDPSSFTRSRSSNGFTSPGPDLPEAPAPDERQAPAEHQSHEKDERRRGHLLLRASVRQSLDPGLGERDAGDGDEGEAGCGEELGGEGGGGNCGAAVVLRVFF